MATAQAATFDRDSLAAFYAKRHLETDAAVEDVYYLPKNAPDREIRLLEVNKEVAESTDLEPVDFGVGIDDAERHVLVVLDVTPQQWPQIQSHQIPLPAGWSLEGMQEFPRNHA